MNDPKDFRITRIAARRRNLFGWLRACLKMERGCVEDQPQHGENTPRHLNSETCCGWSRTTQPRSRVFRQALRSLCVRMARFMKGTSPRAIPSIASLLVTTLFVLSCHSSLAGETAPGREARTLKDCLRPAPKNGGFRMDGQIIWCSSVIKVGDTYHMFASRWPHQYGLGGWTRHSECVRATSSNLLGPYEFQEVVLQKRTNNWDNTRIHNVKIVQAGNKFVLYYIDSANETGFAVADSITGPWVRRDEIAMRVSNPSILVRPDQSIYVFARLKDGEGVNRGIAFTAPDYNGPYSVVANGDNLLPGGGELEDPTIWWANGQYNVLLNDWKGKATDIAKAGAQYFSKDGIHYTLMNREPVFTKTVEYDDGTSETFRRRERPFVYVNEKGEATALFTACMMPDERAWVVAQPVDRYVPGN